MPAVIEALNVTKTFRDFWLREKVTAVNALDLTVEPRQVFGLLGPNGSGKSTTIKMMLGLLFPTRGRISVFGKLPTDVAVKNRIGFLPEESYLYPFLDARETLDYYGRLFHLPRADRRRRIEMLLEMVGLSSVAYRRVGEYSKGMQRRIGLAQALINDPDLLILDEPTSGMDPIGTRQFKDLIQTLALRGKTIVLSSHLLGDVEDVCDQVCILYGGRKRALGRVDELLAKTDAMELTVDTIDEATMAQIEAVLAKQGKAVRGVKPPRDRLEDLFLRIVREAQAQKVSTGGAMAGGAVAEFLRVGGGSRSVIDELVQSADSDAPKTEPVHVSAATESSSIERDVLRQLENADTAPAEVSIVSTSKPATGDSRGQDARATLPAASPSAKAPAKPAPAPQKDADRSVIDSLLSRDQEKGQ
ncbi:MAG: ABC transporter ATP-binding protein [Phycisphaerae bacterium]|nr:ABC transporter ATP-binding protein [Phycisphaerae bacterium]